ncbi:MAG TPA: prolipoprotein diacylglyceryl transferase family protein [Puia sp.]|nr:prolipoprotein diacylglyceryl transferase family protein [Puia sp.]
MYPTFSDLLKDLFGFYLPLPIQTFGFFVALAFLAGAYLLNMELKRREKLGWLSPVHETRKVDDTSNIFKLLSYGSLGFFIGYKLGYIIFHWAMFAMDAPTVLASSKGNPAGGVVVGVLFLVLKYRDKKNKASANVKETHEVVWPHQRVGSIIGIAAIWGFAGAKLFDGLENWNSYMENPWNSFLSLSGLTYYGGLIMAAAGILWYARKKEINRWHLVDSAAPALMLSYGMGRIGCHMAGDGDWGIVNTHPKPFVALPDWMWSYTYPHNISNEGRPIPGCRGLHCFELPQGVYPTSVYEVILCCVLFLVLWGFRKKIKIPGLIFGIYLAMNGTERFSIELIRVNSKYVFLGIEVTQAELISLVLVFSGFVIIFLRLLRPLAILTKPSNT